MNIKTLWYLSEFFIFALYALVGYAITNSWLAGILGAAGIMALHHAVRHALKDVKIEDE